MDFEEIYQTYFGDVFRYIRRLSGDVQLAEEITSETFLKAMRAIGRFRGECDVRVWLCQIAKHCYYSHMKKRRRMVPADDVRLGDFSDPKGNIEENLIRRDEALRLQQMLHEIPEPYREVFMWRVYAELSFRQIGQIFGKSDNWACVTYHRARGMIEKRLEGMNDEK